MREKCCKNCLFFGVDRSPEKYYTRVTYHCQLHGSEASVTDPESQFCGDEHWMSIKVKDRLEKLEQLGI